MSKLIISQLYIYPIKSLGGIALKESNVEFRGLRYDRRWMLVDADFRFISQRENAALALLRISMGNHEWIVHHLKNPDLRLSIPFIQQDEVNQLPRISVKVWDDLCEAIAYPSYVNQWFSRILDQPCSLVYMPEDSLRQIDLNYSREGDINSFSDAYPVLLISEESLDQLNEQMHLPIPMNRFRPNMVIRGGYAHQEDEIKAFTIHDVEFEGVKLCARCNVPGIDQETGVSSSEPTATLVKYRLRDKKVLFGQNVLVKSTGTIQLGDEIILK